jgi:hypothetical protein
MWTLAWGSAVIATALILADKIQADHWAKVLMWSLGCFAGVNGVEKWKAAP